MNTLDILFVLPLLIIFSYLFDAFARKTKFPSVILLMLTGVIIRFFTSFSGYYNFAFLDNLIPVLGTIGLILIVLEGAMELEITKEKLPLVLKGFLAALVILLANIFVLQLLFELIFKMESSSAVLFAIPLSIISSAVAIPSASSLLQIEREFVVYESTFSDILGIMIFNYVLRQIETQKNLIGLEPLISLGLQILGVILISLIITYVLFKLIQQIDHKVKFFLILALLILVYAFGKLFHLPALVTIFIFGIFLSNVKSLLPVFLKKETRLKIYGNGNQRVSFINCRIYIYSQNIFLFVLWLLNSNYRLCKYYSSYFWIINFYSDVYSSVLILYCY